MGKKRVLHELVLTKIAAVDDPCQEPALAVLQKNKDSDDKSGKQAGPAGTSNNEGNTMFDIKKKLGLPETATDDQIEKAFDDMIAKSAAEVEELKKAKAKTDAELLAAQTKATQAEEMAEEMKKAKIAAEGDESFTSVTGTIMKKSELGGAYVAMKEMNDEILKGRVALETSELAKRAETEFRDVPGSIDDKVGLLRLAKRAPEAERTALEKILKSHQEMIAAGMKTLGKSKSGAIDADDPSEKLDQLAKAKAKADGIDEDTALAKVLETSEGAALYAQMND